MFYLLFFLIIYIITKEEVPCFNFSFAFFFHLREGSYCYDIDFEA